MALRGGRGRRLAVAAVALGVLGSSGAFATASSSSNRERPTLLHTAGVIGAMGSQQTPAGSWNFTPLVHVPRRAIVHFRVPERTYAAPGFPYLAASSGDYAAFYLPAVDMGWAELRDPGSVRHWPASVMFGTAMGFPKLYPGRTYALYVAVDHASRVAMPFPMTVLSVRRTSFAVGAVVHPLPTLTGIGAPAGFTDVDLGRFRLSAAAIVADWSAGSSLPGPQLTTGDGCLTQTPLVDCSSGSNISFWSETAEFGPDGMGAHQSVSGQAYDHPNSSPYVAGEMATVTTPAEATELIAFGITPPQL